MLPWTCSESCDRLCFSSCQERQMIAVRMMMMIKRKQVLPIQSSLMSYLYFILFYFVEDPFDNKETSVMRNFNLHYDLFYFCFWFCSCALLSKITHYLFLHGLNRHGYRCLLNAKCEIDTFFSAILTFSLAWGQKWFLTTCSYVWIYKCVCIKIWLWIFIIVFTFCYIVFHLRDK